MREQEAPGIEIDWHEYLNEHLDHDDADECLEAVRLMNAGPPDGAPYSPPQGVWYGISERTYHAHWQAVNNSALSLLAEHSAARLRHHLDHQVDRYSVALVEGKAVHCAVLEPDHFAARYGLDPEPDEAYVTKCLADGKSTSGWRNTKAYKEAKLEAQQGHRELLTQDQWTMCDAIRMNVHANMSLQQLVAGSATEVSIVGHDATTGLTTKTRPDVLNNDLGLVGELKTTRNARADRFGWDLWKFGYHRQAALYLDAAAQQLGGGDDLAHVFIAVEREAPFEVVGYVLTPQSIELGREQNRALLDQYAECVTSERWPGLGTEGLEPLDLPERAYTQHYWEGGN